MEDNVLILGAGMAGLIAARELARANIGVTIIEARDRIGGRMRTVRNRAGDLPIELGAEFVHGAKNELWPLISAIGLQTHEVPDRRWLYVNDSLSEDKQFATHLEQVLGKIDVRGPDLDLESLLQAHPELSDWDKEFTLEYVEGFHAAEPARVSVQSLARAEAAAEDDEGNRQFRLTKGYGALLDWLGIQLAHSGVQIKLGTVVEEIHWESGRVQIKARSNQRQDSFSCKQVLITLPIGVLQEQGPGGVSFHPVLPGKEQAIKSLAMGQVIKITLEFRQQFWPESNFGFIQAIGHRFPTWWSDERGELLTGWMGGPRAEQWADKSQHEIESEALLSLSQMFKKDPRETRELLVASYRHDWSQDPFSRGAYSYTQTGGISAAAQLAQPVDNTLFFAGEATDSRGEQGTVHAALASGVRAASEILKVRKAQPT
jgi:monoamine oxidase